jgi:hypothetical protein
VTQPGACAPEVVRRKLIDAGARRRRTDDIPQYLGRHAISPTRRPVLLMARKTGPWLISAAAVHASIAVFTHVGIGTVRTCPPMPLAQGGLVEEWRSDFRSEGVGYVGVTVAKEGPALHSGLLNRCVLDEPVSGRSCQATMPPARCASVGVWGNCASVTPFAECESVCLVTVAADPTSSAGSVAALPLGRSDRR